MGVTTAVLKTVKWWLFCKLKNHDIDATVWLISTKLWNH